MCQDTKTAGRKTVDDGGKNKKTFKGMSVNCCQHDKYLEFVGYNREENAAYWSESGKMNGTTCALCNVEIVDNRKEAKENGKFFPCQKEPAFICVNRLKVDVFCTHIVCGPCWSKVNIVSSERPKRGRS